MAPELPSDFKEFLKLLHSHGVRYLLIGGYAVIYHGFPRATGDMDIWIPIDPDNAQRMVDAIREFGFDTPDLSPALFLQDNQFEQRLSAFGVMIGRDRSDLREQPSSHSHP